jgi:hypothetical protein
MGMHIVKSSISLSHNNVVHVSETVKIRSQAISSAGLIRQSSITAVDFHGPSPQQFTVLLASGPSGRGDVSFEMLIGLGFMAVEI